MTMGQANTSSSSSKAAAPTVGGVTVSQATPVSAEDSSESDSDFGEDDRAPVSPLETAVLTVSTAVTAITHVTT